MDVLIGYKGRKWHIEPYFNQWQRAVVVERWLIERITIFGDLKHIGGKLWQLNTPVEKQLLLENAMQTVVV